MRASIRRRWPAAIVIAVCAFVAACMFEAFLLHVVAANGVAPFYPRAYDQVEYLIESYRGYDAMRARGVVPGLLGALLEPRVQGWLLQLQAGLLYLLTGPNRVTALDLNIIYLLAFLAIGGGVVYRELGVGPALVFGSVIIGASSITRLVGGVFDFRLDFAALCTWGVVVAVLAFSDGIRTMRSWLALIIAGAAFISVRTLGLVYLVGTATCLLLVVGWALPPADVRATRRRLLGAIAIWALIEGAFVAQNFTLVTNYYIGAHFLSEGSLRAASAGAADLVSSLIYYPRSLAIDHVGRTSLILLIATGVVAIALAAWRRPHPNALPRNLPDYWRWTALVLLTSLVVPYAALTADRDRSDVVGDILLPPVALLGAAMLGTAARRSNAPGGLVMQGLALFGTGCIVIACVSQALDLRRGSSEFSGDSDAGRASRFILSLADSAAAQRAGPVKWSVDAHVDFAAVQVVWVYYYERRGVWPNFVGGLGEGSIDTSLTPADVQTIVQTSDTLILTNSDSVAALPYPYDRSVAAVEPTLRSLAAAEFTLVAESTLYGRKVSAFIRRDSALQP